MEQTWPGVPLIPEMSTGTTDGLFLRNAGIPVYGVASWFMHPDDVRASGGINGAIRVNGVGGGEPHLLLGHDGHINDLAIDPAGRWIASTGNDKTARLWPMPDLSRPAFHMLPREEFLDHLKALTNYRVVADKSAPSGYRVTLVPYSGWQTIPEWW